MRRNLRVKRLLYILFSNEVFVSSKWQVHFKNLTWLHLTFIDFFWVSVLLLTPNSEIAAPKF